MIGVLSQAHIATNVIVVQSGCVFPAVILNRGVPVLIHECDSDAREFEAHSGSAVRGFLFCSGA